MAPNTPPWRLCIQLSASTSGTGAELWRPLPDPNRPLRISKNIPEVSPGPYRKSQVWTDKHSPAGPQRWGAGVSFPISLTWQMPFHKLNHSHTQL